MADIEKQCKLGSVWNLCGLNVTIFGFIAALAIGQLKWINTPLRFWSAVAGILLIILVVTLWGWNRSLIRSINELQKISKDIVAETSSLQEKHGALSNEHDKNFEKFEQLNQHYLVLIAIFRLFASDTDLLNQINGIKINKKEMQ